ncbi:MAG: hypothetical protein P1U56_12940 [Saprospiraceae bacterium]|nr:hypothetical protein [Saprospiraceae bacterium]
MKTLRLVCTSMTLCLLFATQGNAQVITNATPCTYNVKANVIPVGACLPTGGGPVFKVKGGDVITVPMPLVSPHWVVAYGVKRPFIPVKMPGDPACGFIASHIVGFCMGAPAFATYAAENLTIHY